jgi:hypothetical protein
MTHAKMEGLNRQNRILTMIAQGHPAVRVAELNGVSISRVSQIRTRNKTKRVCPTALPRIMGHQICPVCQQRNMTRDARSCFSCAPRDPEMVELDRLIASGRTKPQLTVKELDARDQAKVIQS